MSKFVDQISQTWKNAYDSAMTLTSSGNGYFIGEYKSTAGSITVSRVIGYADPEADAIGVGDTGVPFSLMIDWRNIAPKADPNVTWNYVSGLSGQGIYSPSGDLTLQMNHALIVTNPDGPIQPGFYVDRLEYDLGRTDGSLDASPFEPPQEDRQATSTWVAVEDPSITLALNSSTSEPYFLAYFIDGVDMTLFVGMTNTHYDASKGPYQALAFCSIGGESVAQSMSGWMDTTTRRITLQTYRTQGQVWKDRFFQSTGRTLTFDPA